MKSLKQDSLKARVPRFTAFDARCLHGEHTGFRVLAHGWRAFCSTQWVISNRILFEGKWKITQTFLWLIKFQTCFWPRQNFQKQGCKQIRAQKILDWRSRCKAVQYYYRKIYYIQYPQNIRISLPAVIRPHKTIYLIIFQRSACVFWSLPSRALRKSCRVPPDKSASSGASHAQGEKKPYIIGQIWGGWTHNPD